jgi:hypothetical protein
MLRIPRRGTTPCNGLTRRDALCVGGLSLFAGIAQCGEPVWEAIA